MVCKICYREELHLSSKNVERLEEINQVIEKFAAQGYKLTLRQLYYQLVKDIIIPNKKSEYAKLSHLLKNGRMAGVVDFDAIEDRIRIPRRPDWVEGVTDALEDTIKQYRLNRQEGQEIYIECFSEKDAISNILYRITSYYHIYLNINRGYSSCTAIHDTHQRFEYHDNNVILYLGDHDPSGLDMIRDIRDRLEEFGSNVEVVPVALTTAQVRQYDPPPNPAKITDPRAKWYIQEYGNTSWEVDALEPDVLHNLLREHIESRMDMDLFQGILDQEVEDKEELSEFVRMTEEE
jgi:hypothetical protein